MPHSVGQLPAARRVWQLYGFRSNDLLLQGLRHALRIRPSVPTAAKLLSRLLWWKTQ